MTTYPSAPTEILQYVNMVVLPTSICLGMFGNLITIVIMSQQRFAHYASRYFLTALSLADLSVIITQPFKTTLFIKLTGVDILSLSTIGCKVYYWLYRTGKFISSWLVVFLAMERLAAVRYPFSVKRLFSNRNSFIAIMVLLIVISSFNGGFSYYSDIDTNGRCSQDVYDRNDTETVTIFQHMLNGCAVIYFVAPLIILSITIPIIIISLIQTERKHAKITNRNKNIVGRPTAMLLTVIFAYITLVTPIGVVHVLVNNTDVIGTKSSWFITFSQIAQILEIMNYAINFPLYAGSSQHFRRGVVHLFCVKLFAHRLSRSGTLKTSSSGMNR